MATSLPREFLRPHRGRIAAAAGPEGIQAALRAMVSPGGVLDPLACVELLGVAPDGAGDPSPATDRLLAELRALGAPAPLPALAGALGEFVAEIRGGGVELTGAEAVCAVLELCGVETVFAYPGTSELALCDSIERAAGLRLVNGRGDKECGFMATGGSLLRPAATAAILHGARGLTNAAGAVASARRNEAGTLFVVGLPSTGSARFLPPHGEPNLVATIGAFAGWAWEAPAVPAVPTDRRGAATEFVGKLRTAVLNARRLPARPSMVGLPQDVAETRWVPLDVLMTGCRPPRPRLAGPAAIAGATAALTAARRPLFLVDDYALRYPGLRESLAELAGLLGAPVLQLRYRRGPMLFERLRQEEVGHFIGWLNQFSTEHRSLLGDCDLLVTVEDRNMYRRVIGDLPVVPKIAINGDGGKVRKNEYLRPGDLLVEGEVPATLRALFDELKRLTTDRGPWFAPPTIAAARTTPEPASEAVERMRTSIVGTLARTLRGWRSPVLVDDSQMFGGLVAERYDLLPAGLRMFGDHSGFVGGGLATATGLAIANPGCRVLCTLGDQGFVNSFQGLVCAVEQGADLVILVCNNGESVSLNKQAGAARRESPGRTARAYLRNAPRLSYRAVAEALGVPSWLVAVDLGSEESVPRAADLLGQALDEAGRVDGPALVELELPSDPEVWRGIWLTQGFEEKAADDGHPNLHGRVTRRGAPGDRTDVSAGRHA